MLHDRTNRGRAAGCLVALLLAACSTGRPVPEPRGGGAASEWSRVIRPDDRQRLGRLDAAWTRALAQARAAAGPDVAALGALADPKAGLAPAALPPGRYRCRVVKLGAQQPGLLDYVAYPFFECRVETNGERLTLRKTSGSQRPVGTLWPDGDRRMIFLGAMSLGSEMGAYAYGVDADRDVVGQLERIGERRWRLALPWPRWESNLDLVEIVP